MGSLPAWFNPLVNTATVLEPVKPWHLLCLLPGFPCLVWKANERAVILYWGSGLGDDSHGEADGRLMAQHHCLRVDLLPSFVQGWFLRQDSGLDAAEKNMALAALRSVTGRRTAQAEEPVGRSVTPQAVDRPGRAMMKGNLALEKADAAGPDRGLLVGPQR